jgi:hypothetical protein
VRAFQAAVRRSTQRQSSNDNARPDV